VIASDYRNTSDHLDLVVNSRFMHVAASLLGHNFAIKDPDW